MEIVFVTIIHFCYINIGIREQLRMPKHSSATSEVWLIKYFSRLYSWFQNRKGWVIKTHFFSSKKQGSKKQVLLKRKTSRSQSKTIWKIIKSLLVLSFSKLYIGGVDYFSTFPSLLFFYFLFAWESSGILKA